MFYYLGCDFCVENNTEQKMGVLSFTTSSSYLYEKLSQFLGYCKMSGDIGIGLGIGLGPRWDIRSSGIGGFVGYHVVHSRRGHE